MTRMLISRWLILLRWRGQPSADQLAELAAFLVQLDVSFTVARLAVERPDVMATKDVDHGA
jgi:hypothetical protein